jgi:dienelactone hydrolase
MAASRIVLAPGASGSIAQLSAHESGLRTRGFEVELLALPKGTAERAMPIYLAALEGGAADTIIGGQSFGGRVASLIAPAVQPAALVLFSYPLHAPGRREAWDDRTAHWPRITCPVLLLSGESDPFADLTLLRQAVPRLPRATLITYARQGHSLSGVLDAALDEVAAFIRTNT